MSERAKCLRAAGGASTALRSSTRGARFPVEDDFALTVAVKDRAARMSGRDRRARCRTVASQTEIEGAQEQGLAAPVSTRQHIEARAEFQASLLDHAQSVGVQLQQLRSSRPSRRPSWRRDARSKLRVATTRTGEGFAHFDELTSVERAMSCRRRPMKWAGLSWRRRRITLSRDARSTVNREVRRTGSRSSAATSLRRPARRREL